MAGNFEIHCDPRWLREFRSEAKKQFPRETYGIFLGEIVEKYMIEVEKLVICPPSREKASQHEVRVDPDWIAEVVQEAKLAGLTPVGDIHSHCAHLGNENYAEPVPSKGDFDSLERFQKLLGPSYSFGAILALNRSRVKLRSEVKFWPIVEPLEIVWRKDD